MSRFRPPQPQSKPYITPEGYAALEAEAKRLWVRRRETTEALSAAAAEGDRSENAEYIYRKKELRELDRRIRYLQKRMPALKVVAQVDNPDQVFFGAWVTLEDEQGEAHRFRIVGADELDPAKQTISLDSPMAKALLRRRVDDDISVSVNQVVTHYLIVAIDYQ